MEVPHSAPDSAVASGALASPLLETVMDRSGVGVVVFDRSLRFVFANRVAAEINGRSPEEHIGRSVTEVVPGVADSVVPVLREVFQTGVPVHDAEAVAETPELPGRRRFWHVSYVPFTPPELPDQRLVAAVFVEVTDQRRAQERLTRLIDGLYTFVGLCSPDGTLLEANETSLAAGGLRREDVLGVPLWDTYWWAHCPAVQADLRAAMARAGAGEVSRYDVAVRVAGGRFVTLDFQLVPIVDDGEVTAIVPSGLDVTERVTERARIEALARLSRRLNGALRTEEVAELTVEHGPAVVDADFVNVGLLDRDRRCVHMVMPPVIDVIAERWASIPLDGPSTPFHHVLDTGAPVFVDSTNRPDLFPHLVDDAARAGLESTAAVPLVDTDGTAFGCLGLGWAERVEHTDASRARLAVLADLCSQAMQRVRTTETRDDLVDDLQREILSSVETPAGLDVGVAYRPANNELGFGGDWYDVIDLADGRAVFVVGDVAGHGTSAAARMTATKATIRAFVTASPAEEVIPRSAEALAHLRSGYVATAALAWVDQSAERVQWCLAGHPPPVLRMPDGSTRLLAGVHHPPIGLRGDPRPLPSADFPPGAKLILYTDGLVERRDTDLDVRLEALRSLVEALPSGLPIDELCDRLIAELSDGQDDVAIIVIRHPA